MFLIVSLEYEELGIALVCFLFLADHSTTSKFLVHDNEQIDDVHASNHSFTIENMA